MISDGFDAEIHMALIALFEIRMPSQWQTAAVRLA
jgi:hypothetical protein